MYCRFNGLEHRVGRSHTEYALDVAFDQDSIKHFISSGPHLVLIPLVPYLPRDRGITGTTCEYVVYTRMLILIMSIGLGEIPRTSCECRSLRTR